MSSSLTAARKRPRGSSVAVSYFLCGTPRTGSTFLCSLLASTGRLGRPESYFREDDEVAWAECFGLHTDGRRVRNYAAYLDAVRESGRTDNGVFAARIMWGSIGRIVDGLGRRPPTSDRDVLDRAFGPLRFVYLRREDVVAQAVSWCRAEQTGYWQQGDSPGRQAQLDLDRMKELTETIRDHNAAWIAWFERIGVRPLAVTYEQVIRDARAAVEAIAAHLDIEVPDGWRPTSPHRKQADELNERWAAVLRAALDG